jgi:hypothetical protein
MTMLFDDLGDRDVRRLQLAKRLVHHRARTRTIFQFTGISRHQLASLRRRWRIFDNPRHRGPSPTSFALFFRTSLAQSEGSAAAVIFGLFAPPAMTKELASNSDVSELAVGECLCDVFEAFQACFPVSELEFEHLVLLIRGVFKREAVELRMCSDCRNVTLFDRFAALRRSCGLCERSATLT